MKKNNIFRYLSFSIIFTLLLFFCLFFLFSCHKSTLKYSRSKIEYSRVEFVLGTVCQVRFLTDKPKKEVSVIFDTIFEELTRLDSIFNANTDISIAIDSQYGFRPATSELERVNQNAGIRPVPISDELFELLEFALFFAKKTDGAFNPAIGTLVKLWDIGFSGKVVPLKKDIIKIIPLLDYDDIVLIKKKPNQNEVFLKKNGMRLDLGGIAKGFASDKLAIIIKNSGIEDALIDIGGNILAIGKNAKDKNWCVGIKNPNIGSEGIAGQVKISGKSLVTSGNYERFFKFGGKIFHHILDCKTGYPVETSLNAVSVVSKSSEYADLLSTTCFVLGSENSRGLIQTLNKTTDNEITVFFFYDDLVEIIGKKNIEFSIFPPFGVSK